MNDETEYSYSFHVVIKTSLSFGGSFCAFEIFVALATTPDLVAVAYTGSLCENEYCHDLWLMGHVFRHSSFGFDFGLKNHQRSEIEIVFGNFQNPCCAQNSFNLTSYMKNYVVSGEMCKMKAFRPRWPSVTSQRVSEYCPIYSCLREDGYGGNFAGQYLRKQCKYRNHTFRVTHN